MEHLLFSYGTLQLEKVQIESFGRKLNGKPDKLKGYELQSLQIKDPDVLAKSNQAVHPIAVNTELSKNEVEGTVFEISDAELQQSDQYEVSDYVRVEEQLQSGQFAWVYISK